MTDEKPKTYEYNEYVQPLLEPATCILEGCENPAKVTLRLTPARPWHDPVCFECLDRF